MGIGSERRNYTRGVLRKKKKHSHISGTINKSFCFCVSETCRVLFETVMKYKFFYSRKMFLFFFKRTKIHPALPYLRARNKPRTKADFAMLVLKALPRHI
jgi:hypothetical protein